jgi:hypothetical protein
MKHSFTAEVDWDEVPEVCKCDYTGDETACLPVTIKYKIHENIGTYDEEFMINTSACDSLESGYFNAEEIYDEINELRYFNNKEV